MPFYFEHPSDSDPGFYRVVTAALSASILLHLALLYFAHNYEPERFGERYYEQLVPRKFRVERVEIDPAAFADAEEQPRQEAARNVPVDLPPEQVTFESLRENAPAPPKLDPSALARDEPAPPSEFSASLQAIPSDPSAELSAKLDDIRDQLLESGGTSPSRPTLPLPEDIASAGGAQAGVGMRFGALPGYSELDDLLGQTGPLAKNTAPIFMPGDLLFGYDEAELRGEAIEVLQKLGTLIQRNPRTNFRIEGHTDSFGPPEYNLGLSLRRAEAVKAWLVGQMGIDPGRIQTRGFGSTRLVAPATESIEGQRLNRRVEIVLEVGD